MGICLPFYYLCPNVLLISALGVPQKINLLINLLTHLPTNLLINLLIILTPSCVKVNKKSSGKLIQLLAIFI